METIFLIGLIVLIYIVPEFLRSQRKTQYEYPDIPQAKPTPRPDLSKKHLPHTPPAAIKAAVKPVVKEKVTIPPTVEVPNFIEEKPSGSNSAWLCGIIMAEVLQPPRAHRPLLYRKKI